MVKIVHVSDTHGQLGNIDIPNGDILVHSGDACLEPDLREYIQFNNDLAALPHQHKIVIGGNHDPEDEALCRDVLRAAIYLRDSAAIIGRYKFWGMPWVPGVGFNYNSFTLAANSAELSERCSLIPTDTDVLITHTPPAGILDSGHGEKSIGCDVLRRTLEYRVRPKLHLFGHAHSSNGIYTDDDLGTVFINSAVMDEHHMPTQPVHVFEL